MHHARHFGVSQRTRNDLAPTDFALLQAPGTEVVGKYALEDARARQAPRTPRRRFSAPRARLVVALVLLCFGAGLVVGLLRQMPL